MKITGLILAGGQGSRMGGVEKGLQGLRGKPLIEHVITRLGPQVDTLAINANRSLDAYRRFGLPVWPDLRQDLPGPMAGIEAGLTAARSDYLLTVPCDSPFLPMDLAHRLREAVAASGGKPAYALTLGAERQPHPVFCLLPCALLPDLSSALERGERKLGAWLRAHGAVAAEFKDESAFGNINTLDELQGYESP